MDERRPSAPLGPDKGEISSIIPKRKLTPEEELAKKKKKRKNSKPS